MENRLSFDQLRTNFSLPVNSTSLIKEAIVKKYIGSIVELNNVQIFDIDSIGRIHITPNERGSITVIFNKNDLVEKKLHQFVKNDNVNILAEFAYANYISSEFPREYTFRLISIEKNNPVFIQQSSNSDSNCFIATACYGDCNAPEVILLRRYRDKTLMKISLGRIFVRVYYVVSPFFATIISKSDVLKTSVRNYLLKPIITRLQRHIRD